MLFLVLCFVLPLLSFSAVAEESDADFVFENEFGFGYMLMECTSQEETIVIPAEYNGLPVRSIVYESPFSLSTKKVILPDTLLNCYAHSFTPQVFDGIHTTYGEIEFNEWENGKYLGTESNPYYALIEVIDRSVTQFELHEDTEIIAGGAFENCGSLENITLSEALKYVSFHGLQVWDYENQHGSLRSSIKYNEFKNCYYLGTKDNPYYALIKPMSKQDSNGIWGPESVTEIHPDTKMIAGTAFSFALKDQQIIIPKSVKAIGWSAFFGAENVTVNFEAENEDALLYPLYNPELSETVNIVWGYGSETDESSAESSADDSSAADISVEETEGNGKWIYISVIVAVVIVFVFVVSLKKRNASKK